MRLLVHCMVVDCWVVFVLGCELVGVWFVVVRYISRLSCVVCLVLLVVVVFFFFFLLRGVPLCVVCRVLFVVSCLLYVVCCGLFIV